jgi:hypothetical protein
MPAHRVVPDNAAEVSTDRPERLAEILDRPFASLDCAAYRCALTDKSRLHQATDAAQLFASKWRFRLGPTDVIRLADGPAESPFAPEIVGSPLLQEVVRRLRAGSGAGRIGELASAVAVPPERLAAILSDPLGDWLEAPAAEELAGRVEPLEVSRWPCSIYEISRPYWENTAFVRDGLGDIMAAAGSHVRFARSLRAAHVGYLMGGDLGSFYLPESESRLVFAEWRMAPGQFRDRPVSCPVPVGFTRYFSLLGVGRGSPVACFDGLVWGENRCTWTSANAAANGIERFHPVDVILPAHLEALRRDTMELARLIAGGTEDDRTALVARLAGFFQRLVCLHLFPAGNMGLAMNLVNHVLRRAFGRYLPHLHLDWCAHRLGAPGFVALFARVYERFGIIPGDPESEQQAIDGILAFRREQARLSAAPAQFVPQGEAAALLFLD